MEQSLSKRRISKLREYLALLLVVALALFALVSAFNDLNVFGYLERTFRNGGWLDSSVYRFGGQLACLKDELPIDQTVGFVADLSPTENTEYYQLTQYFLTPVLVDLSPRHSIVIGYAPQPSDLERILQSHPDLRISKNCENGIILFAGEP